MEVVYHPKLLNLFTKDELHSIMENSVYSVDKSKRVDVIVSLNTKIDVEIYCDCEATQSDVALISLLDDKGYSYPEKITKELFLKAFYSSQPTQVTCMSIDE